MLGHVDVGGRAILIGHDRIALERQPRDGVERGLGFLPFRHGVLDPELRRLGLAVMRHPAGVEQLQREVE